MRLNRTAAFVALWRQLRAAHREGPGLGVRLRALPRMVGASLRRRQRYDGLGRLLLMAVAMLYVVWPLELIPELLLGPLGLVEDAVVVAWLAGAVIAETGRFLEWERQQLSLPGGSGAPGVAPAQLPHGVADREVRDSGS